MPTYAQLQAEPCYGREVVTAEMAWLGDELCRRTGRPRDAVGTKGNNVHLRGAHRSQEWIKQSRYCTSRTYTVQTGLTNEQLRHIAGFDFTPGSASAMIAQCKRLMAAMKAGLLNEVLELFGNVDGDSIVDGYDNLHDRAATSDSSHLWHWHLTIDRRHCRNKALMQRIISIALGDAAKEPDVDLDDKIDPDGTLSGYNQRTLKLAVNDQVNERAVWWGKGSEIPKEHRPDPNAPIMQVIGLPAKVEALAAKLDALAATPPGTVVIDKDDLKQALREVLLEGVNQANSAS